MNIKRFWSLAFCLVLLASGTSAQARPNVSCWQGTAEITTNGTTFAIPVHLQLEGKGSALVGSFVDGPQQTRSTSGELLSGQDLVLHFAHYAVTFRGKIAAGQLTGNYSADSGRFFYPVTLQPAPEKAADKA